MGMSVYFLMLGLGYLVVEIPMLQQFTLFLGHPIYSITVVLASLLVASGCGSLLGERLAGRGHPAGVAMIFTSLLALLAAVALGLGDLLRLNVGLPFAVRVLIAVAILTPIGILLGMPFPLGLRILHAASASRFVPWAWAINGAASVAAPVIAMLVAITWGFSITFLIGTAAYLTAALLWMALRRHTAAAESIVRAG